MLQRTVHWQGVDNARRFDVVNVKLDRDRLSANGTSRTDDYQLQWSLRTGAEWVTRLLDVQVTASTWSRRLALIRDATGRWAAEGRADGVPVTARGHLLTIDGSDWDPAAGASPGIIEPPSVVGPDEGGATNRYSGRAMKQPGDEGVRLFSELLIGADDCDLGLCPLTKTMPMIRSVLPRSGPTRSVGGATPGPELDFVMAWVEVPSLRVIRSQQSYQLRRIDVDGTSVVRYIGLHRSFEGELSVDRNGLVIDYPQLARRVDKP